MAISNDKQVKKEEKKPAEKKVKKARITKSANSGPKRGQPIAAARLISSPYIKFGWHKPLGADIKDMVQELAPQADSMYMLQISRERPINSLSLRNGIFWEHRQLKDERIVSTPALDHIDLFPVDDEAFEETLRKIGKRPSNDDENGFLLHYLFEEIRHREFLLLPIEVTSGDWVTIITRMELRLQEPGSASRTDRKISDFAIVDPQPHGREARRELIMARLPPLLEEGCIQFSTEATARNIVVPDLASAPSSNWQSGLVAYAISREFLRRLKTLQFQNHRAGRNDNEDFLWAPFEEDYNFDAYRQNLMSACAHQTIEASGFRVRLALEVPSDDSSYQPSLLHHEQDDGIRSDRDEKWGIFKSPTHTVFVGIGTGDHVNVCPIPDDIDVCTIPDMALDVNCSIPNKNVEESPEINPASYTTTSPRGDHIPDEPISPTYEPTSPPYEPNSPNSCSPCSPTCSEGTTDNALEGNSHEENQLPDAGTGAPVAPMGPHEFSPKIPGLTSTAPEAAAPDSIESDSQDSSKKRARSEDGDDELEEPPKKKVRFEDESQS
ncbi:hypothetical protein F4803DRAFT_409319 [Xylaria telfairii]|nr:hypothetical protein F4803DRAFT_409319 [Xylaria telfairii]